MKDALGNKLEVGQRVAYIRTLGRGHHAFSYRYVVKITAKQVAIGVHCDSVGTSVSPRKVLIIDALEDNR